MPNRLYFKGHSFKGVIFEGMETTGSDTFDAWLSDTDWDDELEGYDEGFVMERNFVNTRLEYVYNIDEEWKHMLVDGLATNTDIDVIEKIIGEIGFRKVMEKVHNCDYYQDALPELWTELGIRQVFYILLEEFVKINDEFYKEITEAEYNEWFDEDDDEDDDAIVPITDEEFEKIGGGVAQVA